MPYKDRRYTTRAANILRERRHNNGQCVQCASHVDISPITGDYYWLCDDTQRNCRGANNASKARCLQRKKGEVKDV